MKEISISKLTKTFPGFIWVSRCLELCGWNPDACQWIVIEDGICMSHSGRWVVTVYQLREGEQPIRDGYKYCDHEQIITQHTQKLTW